MNSNFKVHLGLFAVALLYGANYSVAKLITPHIIPPFAIIILRVFVAGFLFWMVSYFLVNEKIKHIKDYFHLFICAVFGVATNQLMFFKGLSITTSINAALIMTITPILVLITSSVILKERITVKKISGIFLGATGAIIIIAGEGFSFNGKNIFGDVLIFLNATSYGIYLVIVKPLMLRYNALTVVKWTFLFGAFMVLPFGWNEFTALPWNQFESFVFYSIAFIILGTTFLAYLINAWTLKYVNSSVVGIYIYLQPLLATFFSIILGQGGLNTTAIISGILIFSGVYLVSVR